MKALYNDVLVPTVFKPIAVTILIESRLEFDALIEANSNLTPCEIHDGYEEAYRDVWVRLIDTIADNMKGQS
jgi:hypothetical protein